MMTMKTMMMKALFPVLVMAFTVGLGGSASATPDNDTTSAGTNQAIVQNLTTGHSQYANFFYEFGTSCGTIGTYNSNGVRVSRNHPGYEDMVNTLRLGILTRAELRVYFENISGQCWAKRILIWNP